MRICVFGAASNEIDKKYINAVEKLSFELAKRGHDLVFGAGGQGLMGAAAVGFKKGGANIIGVIPTFFKEANIEAIYKECDELIFTETMRERKGKMEDLADAFIIVPGGVGTFEEFFEVLTLKQLARHNKPIAVYNYDGYYDNMDALLDTSIKEGFVKKACKTIYKITTDENELIKYLENDEQNSLSIKDMKNG